MDKNNLFSYTIISLFNYDKVRRNNMSNQIRKKFYDDEKEDVRSKFLKAASKWAEKEGYYQEADLLLEKLLKDE